MSIFGDRKFRLPRIWSNRELGRFAPLFSGDVINVSGWNDLDKEGRRYRDYFINARTYTLSNYTAEARGFQGLEEEIFLDLEKELPGDLAHKFDVVFNHTVLEHVFDFQMALKNLCRMTRDILILCVPFLQQMHATSTYGDYWRFTPLAMRKLLEDNGMLLLYSSFNSHRKASVYIFLIATKQPEKWSEQFDGKFSYTAPRPPLDGFEPYVGCHAIPNTMYTLRKLLKPFSKVPGRVLHRLHRLGSRDAAPK
jgi:SAM-dependent methyltransferase